MIAGAPWSAGLLGRLMLAQVIGVAGLVVSWIGASGRSSVADQIVWLNVGVVSMVTLLSADGVLLFAARFAVGQRIGRLRASSVENMTVDGGAAAPDSLVAIETASLFHRAGCELVAGRAVVTRTREQHMLDGLTPCGVCVP